MISNENAIITTGKPSIGKPRIGSLADRLKNANFSKLESSNVIQLLLDCSASMGFVDIPTSRISILKQACFELVKSTDLSKYYIAIDTFPSGIAFSSPINIGILLKTTIDALSAPGSDTPLGKGLERILKSNPKPSRVIIVSDGYATDFPLDVLLQAKKNNETSNNVKTTIPIHDCVHIGDDHRGEETLRKIAELTGGIYMKFVDLVKFKESFKYLSPSYYGLLCSGKIDSGAKERS
jgi:uncharacterized protein YegL